MPFSLKAFAASWYLDTTSQQHYFNSEWFLSYVLWTGKKDRKIIEIVPSILSIHSYNYPSFNKGYLEGYTAQKMHHYMLTASSRCFSDSFPDSAVRERQQ